MRDEPLDLSATRKAWDTAAMAAFERIRADSEKSLELLADDLHVSRYTLDRWQSKGWPLAGVLRLAAATDQDPVTMLSRERLP